VLNNCIASWSSFGGEREFWRFFYSGQFEHIFSFREDNWKNNKRNASMISYPEGFIPSGYVDVIMIIYTITEIYEFANRLMQKGILSNEIHISIAMHNVADRILFCNDQSRLWHYFHKSDSSFINHEILANETVLLAYSSKLARDAIVHFYENFQWLNSSDELIKKEQEALLRGLI
jgi:hypothetical protein